MPRGEHACAGSIIRFLLLTHLSFGKSLIVPPMMIDVLHKDVSWICDDLEVTGVLQLFFFPTVQRGAPCS